MSTALLSALAGATIQDLYRELLLRIGEDPSRDGLLKTPERMEEALKFLTSGYEQDALEILHEAYFESEYGGMVVVRDIEFYSMCEHHMLPFFGRAHIAYVPNKKVIGLSKFPRLLNMYARRLQVQERLTEQVAHAIMQTTHAQGVAVVIEASHLCMMMRGVEKQNSTTSTSTMLGIFLSETQTRSELLSILAPRGRR
ncbi:GTP cyclohydrolase I FolE [Tunturiibacter gelidoferens]|uniref:GTP cyclohydrolase 1 n=1 Tax=Tunturiibacter gelidiferens TaxID=3069689 RepID=A0A9X0QCQ4_9BACT|nr:GTP cyclohydrolase I FolE [Edaphobacter lichenicola]MBB5327860.1 GTP cyclohydrolase I [Edaphobacter lichenicola]